MTMNAKIRIRTRPRPDGKPIKGQDMEILAVTEDGAEYLLPAEFVDIYCAGRHEEVRARLTLPVNDLTLDGVLEKCALRGIEYANTPHPQQALEVLLMIAQQRAKTEPE